MVPCLREGCHFAKFIFAVEEKKIDCNAMQLIETSSKPCHFLPVKFLSMEDGRQGSLFSVDELFSSGTTTDSRKNLKGF